MTATELVDLNYLPTIPKVMSGVFLALRAGRLDIVEDKSTQAKVAVFGLTNLILRSQGILVRHPSGNFPLQPLRGPSEKRVQTLKDVLVTAELEVARVRDLRSPEEIVDEVCYLLSLAQGTKIQWVYRGDFDTTDQRLLRTGFSRITKPYSPLCVIDYLRPGHTDDYLAASLLLFIERKDAWALNRLFDAYLDAKSETDFLEMRGVKLAVAVEMLKASFFHATGQREYLMQLTDFQKLIRRLQKAVRPEIMMALIRTADRKLLYSNCQSLSRVPFRAILEELCRYLSLRIDDKDIALFVRSRDSLIHQGLFLTQTCEPSRSLVGLPFRNPHQEFFWLLHFIDRLFLRLVGYNGPYLDWSATESPASREL